MSDVVDARSSLTMSELFDRTAELLRRNALRALAAMGALTLLGVLVDLGGTQNEAQLPMSLLSVFLQYWLTRSLLVELGADSNLRGGFGSWFGLGIVAGLGIALGLIFLVVPGVILWVRWSIAGPAIVADRNGVGAALSYSWDATRLHFWPILGTLLAVYFSAGAVAAIGFYLESESITVPGIILSELSINGLIVLSTHVAMAIFVALRSNIGLSEVFA